MYKILLTALLSFSIYGCSEPVKPPKIKTLKRVSDIEISVKNTCVCGDDLKLLINHDRQLRKSETYYIEQLTIYNEKFTK